MQVRGRFAGLVLGAIGLLSPATNIVNGEATTSPAVTITLKAPWAAPPLILEILELIPRFNATGYFHALDKFTSSDFETKGKPFSTASDGLVYEKALDFIFQELVAPEARQLFELFLSLHNTAPAVQAYYHFYNETVVPEFSAQDPEFDATCRNWIQFREKQYCQLQSFKTAFTEQSKGSIPGESYKLLSFDHFYSKSQADLASVILYGDIESPDFQKYHRHLMSAANKKKLNYVVRYLPPAQTDGRELYLSGYGVHDGS
ncbi:killer toxin resistant protein [Entomophthora muscae]|uniref:Killer toxin resistant protein n=1 Tax=Entomophthora muscae TaxID=34485 RepID=A0ACC2SH69_9FUNG|nr:killer toxin resistant protein [Entomophthora muscae]